MRYKIEFLLESTDDTSVCHSSYAEARTLDAAMETARDRMTHLPTAIDGFQIRDDTGVIVMLEHLNL